MLRPAKVPPPVLRNDEIAPTKGVQAGPSTLFALVRGKVLGSYGLLPGCRASMVQTLGVSVRRARNQKGIRYDASIVSSPKLSPQLYAVGGVRMPLDRRVREGGRKRR